MNKKKDNLTSKQKVAMTILFVFAIFSVFYWKLTLKNNLEKPFKPSIVMDQLSETVSEVEFSRFCPNGDCPLGRESDLITRDTDNDGLNDWEEIYIYNTSPYLEDTDGDGVNDRVEIENGDDPNCIGEDCGVKQPLMDENASGEAVLSPKEAESAVLEEVINAGLLGNKQVKISEEEFADVLSGKMDANTLRTMLKEAGMEESILNEMTDEVLMQSYAEIIAESN